VVDAARFASAVADGSARQVLDVRSPAEWQTGSLAGAHWRYVPYLVDRAPTELDAAHTVWVVCASGFRASIAAGLLQRDGYMPVVLTEGGVGDVLAIRSRAGSGPHSSHIC
jgi:hydroxyacylglutathione hydrolase